MTLQEVRSEWEKNLTPVAEGKRGEDTVLVILRDKHGKYHCHRYFAMGQLMKKPTWEISVDARDVNAEKAMSWSMKPQAIPAFEETEE